jgi:hypothetical protein
MNETTAKLINWIWSEPKLADFLREIAKGDEFEYGDYDLGCWINDLVFLDGPPPVPGIDAERIHRLYAELTEGRDKLAWIDEMDVAQIRDALLGQGGGDTYVHALTIDFHPGNRYRVYDKNSVFEAGWTGGSGLRNLPEQDRQVCPEPIGTPCNCTVEQKEK